MERFILVQSPILAHPPAAKCESSTLGAPARIAQLRPLATFCCTTHTFGQFQIQETDSEYNSTPKTLPQTSPTSIRAANVAPELHSGPVNLS